MRRQCPLVPCWVTVTRRSPSAVAERGGRGGQPQGRVAGAGVQANPTVLPGSALALGSAPANTAQAVCSPVRWTGLGSVGKGDLAPPLHLGAGGNQQGELE